jgi:hypothetical protein
MIPLGPDSILGIWRAVKGLEFESTHGLIPNMDVRDEDMKKRVLESMKIQVRHMGYDRHALLDE